MLEKPARRQIGEYSGSAAEVGDARAARQAAEPHVGGNEPGRSGVNTSYSVAHRMGVEEGDLLLLVLDAVDVAQPA